MLPYQLVQVPSADAHRMLALVLVHATREVAGRLVAPGRVPGVAAVRGLLLLLLVGREGRVLFRGLAGAAKKAADGVADRAAECNATNDAKNPSGQLL